ncbi:MAG: Sll0314/Alr1548 family TPR repeat-containing protein [Cyanobacteria bacterium J06635_1]
MRLQTSNPQARSGQGHLKTLGKSIKASLGGLTALALAVTTSITPTFAADPFRTDTQQDIGPHTEAAFEAFFKSADYVEVRESLDLALEDEAEAEDPLVHAMSAAISYIDEDWDTLATKAELTKESAEVLIDLDDDTARLRGHLYAAVGIFLEGAHMLKTQGVARSTPSALAMLQKVFSHIGEAEKIDRTDPELNLVKGYMDLFLAVNLPFADPEDAIERLSQYGSPSYLSYRGIALGYRDLEQVPEAIDAVDHALVEAPENPELFYLKAQLLRRQQDIDASVAMFDEALNYAAQLPQPLARKIFKERCRTLGKSHEACGAEADAFIEAL